MTNKLELELELELAVVSEQEGAEHTALGAPVWSIRVEEVWPPIWTVQYPVTECGTQAQSAKFANQFHGGDCVECWAEINKQHSDRVEGSGDGILCGLLGSESKWWGSRLAGMEPLSQSTSSEWRWVPPGGSCYKNVKSLHAFSITMVSVCHRNFMRWK